MSRLFLVCLFLMTSAMTTLANPKVVVSIKPIHSITTSLMDGIAEPELLMEGNISPHDFSLKPSQVKSLQDADIIIWIGEGLETSLTKPIQNLTPNTDVIELLELDGLTRHEYRELGGHDHDKHDDHDEHAHNEHKHDEHLGDPHLWLDLSNAMKIADKITENLIKIDQDNKAQYEANLYKTTAKLIALSEKIKTQLQSNSSKNYIVFHDAYQYFEKEFDLNQPIAITVHPEIPLGAARIKEIKAEIAENQISCLFSEPQFSPKVINVLAENTKLDILELDPLGSKIAAGSAHYFETMTALANNFEECFKK